MAYTYTFSQGDDLLLEIPIKDLANNNVDLTTATEIVATLTKNNAPITKGGYSLNAISGYGTLALKSGVGNEHIIEIQIKRTESQMFPDGALTVEVLVEFPDAILTDKSTNYQFSGYVLVKKSINKDVPIR